MGKSNLSIHPIAFLILPRNKYSGMTPKLAHVKSNATLDISSFLVITAKSSAVHMAAYLYTRRISVYILRAVCAARAALRVTVLRQSMGGD